MKNTLDSLGLNNPERYYEIFATLNKKKALYAFYNEVYQKYLRCIQSCPMDGLIVEIGSGAGFAKKIIPQLISTDVVSYPNIDRIMDATQMDFPDSSLACICMFNVLHHIPNTPHFFKEAIRCLQPKGRIFMVEPYAGWISSFVFRYLHHEDFDMQITSWEFKSSGPVSDANNALPTVIFERDIDKFRQQFPQLSLIQFAPHAPFRYWLTGGLKKWSLLPKWGYNFARELDNFLIKLSPRLGSFVDIELTKL